MIEDLDQQRYKRKLELVKIRKKFLGHRIDERAYQISPEGFELESKWLDKDSSYISRGLPLFGDPRFHPKPRISQEFGTANYYHCWEVALNHLDSLNHQRNPNNEIGRSNLPCDHILDMGCGRGVALEDIWAYYGLSLNLYLKGNTLHTPGYNYEFLRRGIEINQGGLLEEGDIATRPTNGYSLIMANMCLIYYENPLQFIEAAAGRLSPEGIFPVEFKNVFKDKVEVVDSGDNKVADPITFITERFQSLGWEWNRNGSVLTVKYHPAVKIGLRYLSDDEASELSFYKKPPAEAVATSYLKII